MSESENNSSRGGIQVIARAAAILRVLGENQGGMSLGQIADRVGLPRSTVQRIVGALQSERFVTSDGSNGGLRLGPSIGSLAEAARHNIVEQCRLTLAELAQRTGETADLSILRGAGMVFLDQVPGTHRLRTVSSVGEVFPLTTTANGKACLSQLPEASARELVSKEWQRNRVKGDMDRFLAELSTIRETGLAHDLDNHTTGISAIGFSFRDWAGDLHAISIPIPTTRFKENQEAVEAELLRTAVDVRKMMA